MNATVKSRWPLLLVMVGVIILAIGIWQMADVKMQTKASLKKAEEVISKQTVNSPTNLTPKHKLKMKKPDIGDTIGILQIPKIGAELPIVEGTDPDDLAKGVGHYKGSQFPGNHGQIVLSGHRDTVFRHLGVLKIGDILEVKMPNGNFDYKIDHMKIVDSKDTSIITLQNKKEELVLTTCYPFRYIGNAPNRYIIYAYPKK
jgi:sortase A